MKEEQNKEAKRPIDMIKRLIAEPQERFSDPDLSLIEQIKGGNEDSFRHLMTRHKDKVRNLIFFTVNDADLVDDLAQEVFIKVFRKIDKFRYESKFTTWLYRITVNHCKDQLRKKRFWKFFEVFESGHEDLISTNNAADYELSDAVHGALGQLPDKLRIPLVLKELEGFSYKEIANITETEMGTVKSRIFRAREALKDILSPMREDLEL